VNTILFAGSPLFYPKKNLEKRPQN